MTLTINAPPARGSRWSVYSLRMVGLTRLELVTSRLSGVRSNHLSYRPATKVLRYNKTDLRSLARTILNFFSNSLETSLDLVKLRAANRTPHSRRRFPRRKASPRILHSMQKAGPGNPGTGLRKSPIRRSTPRRRPRNGISPFRRPTTRRHRRRRHPTSRRSTMPGWGRPRRARRPSSGDASSNRWR